jgi:Tfp pilus assembly protein PilO
MSRLLIPIVLVGAAIGLFALYTNPTYQSTKELQAQAMSYDDALNKSQELRTVRDQLLSKRNTFSADDIQKLQEMLPDNVDNIRLIIDINNIASRHNLSLQNVSLGTISNSRTTRSATSAGASGDAVGSVEIGFSVTTSYDNMLAFIQDVEHSLRLIDIENLSFSATAGDNSIYSMSIRTYWLQ